VLPDEEPYFENGDEPIEGYGAPQPAAASKSTVKIHPLINGKWIEL
jgi:hypothetical protein